MAQLVVLGLTRLQLSEPLQLQLAHPALSPVLNPGTAQRELASADAQSVLIGDLHTLLRDQSALVLTALDHTTCLVRAHLESS